MWENNQEMLQQYCDNNDQTNPTLINHGYFKYSTKIDVLHHKYNNLHRGDHEVGTQY